MIIIILAAGIAGLVGYIASRPDDFRITRSATIGAPVSEVFDQVNNVHHFNTWSPWIKLDPAARIDYTGPSEGVDASYSWAGNKDIGEGTLTLIESEPDKLVKMRIEFSKPFQGTNMADLTFEPQGEQTLMTWSMYGKNNFMSKAMGLVMNCDQMVGSQFEDGFNNLKAIVEKQKVTH